MRASTRFSVARFSVAALSAVLLTVSAAQAQTPQGREEARLLTASEVLDELRGTRDQYIPDRLLERAYGIAVIPDVIKIGFGFGGRRGKGVLVVRDSAGKFTSPVFVALTGGSFGWQIGAQSTDVVLVFTTREGVEGISDGKVTLGADASVAAGPVGRQASAATDASFSAEVYSYSRNRGLFAGVALDGSALTIDRDANAAFYNKSGVRAAEIMNGQVTTGAESAQRFLRAVSSSTAAAGTATPATQQVPASQSSATMPPPEAPPAGAVKVYPLDPSQPGQAPQQ